MLRVYYKIQYFDNVSLTWRDIQRQIADRDEAVRLVAGKPDHRIMHVDGKKRVVLTPPY